MSRPYSLSQANTVIKNKLLSSLDAAVLYVYPTCQPAAKFIPKLSGQLAASLLGDAGSRCEHHLQESTSDWAFCTQKTADFPADSRAGL